MGTLSLKLVDRLYWLGRYMERAYQLHVCGTPYFDPATDGGESDYGKFLSMMGIPNPYENTEAFCRGMIFDKSNPNSMISSLGYCYDNAIVSREALSSDALSFIQMAVYELEAAADSTTPVLGIQKMVDNLFAFRGCMEETVEKELILTTIRVGTSVERLDTYLRLGFSYEKCYTAFERLQCRILSSNLTLDNANLGLLTAGLASEEAFPAEDAEARFRLVKAVEGLFPGI